MKLALGTCVAMAVAIPLSVVPVIRSVAEGKAAERGLALEIAEVSLGFGKITLRGVRAKSRVGTALEFELDAVEVVPTWALEVHRIAMRGGRVALRGSLAELRRAFEALRGPRGAGGGATRKATPERRISVEGLGVSWHPGPKLHSQHIWGLSARFDGKEAVVRFDLGRFLVPGFGVDVAEGHAQFVVEGGLHPVERIGARSVSAWVDLNESGPQGLLGDLLGEEGVRDQTSSAGGGSASGAKAVAHRGRRLRQLAQSAATSLDRVVPNSGALELVGLVLEVRSAEQRLKLGPAGLRLAREGGWINAALRPAPSAATGLEVLLRLPLHDGPVDFRVAGGPVSLAALGVREGDFGLRAVQSARFEARTEVRLLADGGALEFDGAGSARDLTLHQPGISASTLRHINVAWSGRGSLRFDEPRLEVEAGQLEIGAVRLEVTGSVERSDAHVALDVHGRVPLAACQTMIESAPAGLFPALEGLRLSGAFSLDTKVAFDSRRPSDILVNFGLDNRCVVTHAPEAVDPHRYLGTFMYHVQTEGGVWIEKQSGPGTSGWAELGNISKYMEAAVLVCEDGRFYRHDGFDQFAIQSAIRQNLEAGKFLRGASTVSMQLAKNLYLGREKTLARKLQEAVFTMMLEQELTKEQILELYLNVIEYGPGLYGIGPATRFYFDKEPAELSMAQSFYLASILPNPRHDHFDRNGELSRGWQNYLRRLMTVAHERRLVTEEELEIGLGERLVFGRPTPLTEGGTAVGGDPVADPFEGRSTSTGSEGSGVRLMVPGGAPVVKPRRARVPAPAKPSPK